jgi:hypothetical protein
LPPYRRGAHDVTLVAASLSSRQIAKRTCIVAWISRRSGSRSSRQRQPDSDWAAQVWEAWPLGAGRNRPAPWPLPGRLAREAARQPPVFGSDGLREQTRLCPTTDPACQQHDNQHKENEPANTTPHCRPTEVKTAAAEQQQKNYQQNYHIHSALLSGFVMRSCDIRRPDSTPRQNGALCKRAHA